MSFLESLREKRQRFLDGLEANEDEINLGLFEDFYPDKAHFIYELLQNAEDAKATEVNFHLSNNCLTFEHNGRPFNEEDVKAITGIGFSTKRDDANAIGRFGVGFKAVFLYTLSPRIRSPNHAFEITKLVLPSALPPALELGQRTRFEFPFNAERKSQSQAFSEVRTGLEEISDRTLLFLSNIEEIHWQVDGGGKVSLLQISNSEHHLEVLREIDGGPTETSRFLRFLEPVDGLEGQNVAVAFELEPRSGEKQYDARASFASRFRIVPAEPGCVAVYFTAAKETSNLRFHLHAPFVPELSRSSIKETPANEPLFRQLAELAARSLSTIRDLGLLDRDFLAVLPNDEDGIPDHYSVIQDAIVGAMNEQPLTPTHAGGHAAASQLLRAEAGLKNLLDRDDIRFLYDGEDDRLDWAIAATQRNNLVDRFLGSLDIEEWGIAQFVKTLDERCSNRRRYCYSTHIWTQGPDRTFLDWMRQKPLDWHRALYALLYPLQENRPGRFNQICIVRRSDGEYGTGDECYFPTPGTREDPIHPRVEEETYAGGGTKVEQSRAKLFLEGIGVREIGEQQQIEAILERRYSDPEQIPSWDIHASDLGRFISLVEQNSSASTLFNDYAILQGADGLLHRPCELYLDSPYSETGLEAYYGRLEADVGRTALSDRYHQVFDSPEQLVLFAGKCGVAKSLVVSTVDCSGNPENEYLRNAPGYYDTGTGTDRDFTIHWLQALFQKPTLVLSRLVWNTLCVLQKDRSILRATYRVNQSNEPHHADSQLVHLLRNAAWIPQGDNEPKFVRPAEALRDLLPDGFPFDPSWDWLTAIHFGEEDEGRAAELRRVQNMAQELGFTDAAALDDAIRFGNLSPETRRRILAEHAAPADLPEHTPDNPGRRAERVGEEARKAAKRRTEKRQQSVSVNRDRVKREGADPYLRELYTNADDETICQACQDRLPFKLDDERYFFETVEFLPELNRHHHQNYLALCPNHAAMFMHANDSKEDMKDLFLNLDGNRLELTLAKQSVTVYFTDTHIQDLRTVTEVDDEG